MSNFNRRQFLGAAGAGVLAVGFSLSGNAHAAKLPAAKSVAKDALDTWLTIDRQNQVTVYVGKVDLGTGTQTALAQIAAEELSVPFNHIHMVMGDTGTTPDQWLTGAALTIQQGGSELRVAAASARAALIARAAVPTASMPDPHKRLMVAPGNSIGSPAKRLAIWPTLRLSSPAWLTHP